MADSVIPKIVFLLTFIGIFALFTAAVSEVITTAADVREPPTPEEIAGEYFTGTEWDPAPAEITPDTITSEGLTWFREYVLPTDSRRVVFTQDNQADTKMWLLEPVFAPSQKVLFFSTSYKGGLVFGHHYRSAAVSLATIEALYDPNTNYSKVYFDLRFMLELDVTYDNVTYSSFSDALDDTTFEVTLVTPQNVSITETSPWSLVGRMLSFNLPDTPFIVNVLIAVPLIALLAATVLAIVSSFVPFVPGLK